MLAVLVRQRAPVVGELLGGLVGLGGDGRALVHFLDGAEELDARLGAVLVFLRQRLEVVLNDLVILLGQALLHFKQCLGPFRLGEFAPVLDKVLAATAVVVFVDVGSSAVSGALVLRDLECGQALYRGLAGPRDAAVADN